MTSEITRVSLDREPPALGPFDRERVERAVRELLIAVGEDPDREGLLDTPARVARAYEEIFGGMRLTAEDVLTTTFDLGHDEMVLVRDIELWSMCEHHLVPFTGVAHVGYIPRAQRQSAKPDQWFGATEYINAGQSKKNFEYSRLYPRWVLFRHQPRYASWGQVVCIKG